MSKRRVALGFFGISYTDVYQTSWGKLTHIDWRLSIDNYRQRIFSYFEQQGFDILTFLSTYKHRYIKELVDDLQPFKYTITSKYKQYE